ncbi:MAG: gamma-glutamyltransferase, partial [Gammaproteobacteria bacterium]
MKGAVAAGHRLTAEAAAEMLRAGGNAFDAAIAGFFAACVTEPVLASPGGGGFLLARDAAGKSRVFDFFAHTPRAKPRAREADFFSVTVDFGAAQQEFHIGLGSCAAPGAVRGMFSIHRELGTLPMRELVRPAAELARAGVEVNSFQSYLVELVGPICRTESAFPLFASSSQPGKLVQPGDVFTNPQLADFLETLAREGEAFFTDGEIAAAVAAQCIDGGFLSRADLRDYEVVRRAPLEIKYRGRHLLTNPAPSAGGLLIAFGLELLKKSGIGGGDGGGAHSRALTDALRATCEARSRHFSIGPSDALLHPKLLAQYRREVSARARATRGTTHLSAIDAAHNIASLTVSNGEGCGRLLPGAGFMLNNMLGEEDLNPGGFHRWRPNQRMSSMMAPSILLGDTAAALGSGGSNRIRTAILQVVSNIIDFGMDLPDALAAPRMHIEGDALYLEAGWPAQRAMQREFPNHRVFTEPNMFFGGVHVA